MIACSEAGALPVDPSGVGARGRVGPGGMLVVDTAEGTVRDGVEIIDRIAASQPFGKWLRGVHVAIARDDCHADVIREIFETECVAAG